MRLRRALPLVMAVATWYPSGVVAQDRAARERASQDAAGRPLASFTSLRVAIVPIQFWRADSAGWSRAVSWSETRLAIDSTVQVVLQERGLAKRWSYASDLVRIARRNPTYASDPYSLGAGRWRAALPKAGEAIPALLADNLRPFTALSDARYALVPVELRVEGEAVVLRLVLADTRMRTVTWVGELASPRGPRMVAELSTRVANLIIEP